jgi:lipopolysaccharide transport system ATP-binding protein
VEPILRLEGVGKSYRSYRSAWWRIAGWVTGRPSHFDDHWVLRDVTFTLGRGEAVGIVGRNGAGKSTLLKMIASTLQPTVGALAVHGRVSAILELGMGFNPEFTGRDNARYACGLLGLDRATIERVLPEVESFADIGAYFDQPARTYSSGMTMRVAFAVATALRPDLLIVDEALSVGDAAFQRKSFRRIEDFLAQGTSLLFVSHGTELVKRICDRAIWLDTGRVAQDGSSKAVVEAYERSMLGAPIVEAEPHAAAFLDDSLAVDVEEQYGSGDASIFDFAILDESGRRINSVPQGEDLTVTYKVRFAIDCIDVCFGMMVKSLDGICVYATNSAGTGGIDRFAPGEVARVQFTLSNRLMPGIYFLNCGVTHRTAEEHPFLHRRVDVAALRVLRAHSPMESAGLADLECRVNVTRDRDVVGRTATTASVGPD